MRRTELIMGMPVTVEIEGGNDNVFKKAFDYFRYVDAKFSTYKKTSEITKINEGKLAKKDYSADMKEIFKKAAETKDLTHGYFNIEKDGYIDPSGIVKGWAIYNAAKIIEKEGFKKYFVDAGGDIQVNGKLWKVGIRNPFNLKEIIKVVNVASQGVATSGTYERGQHVYDPIGKKNEIHDIVAITVIGENIYEADRMATAAFAMGGAGIKFIDGLPGFEGYMIDKAGTATMTRGFNKYL